MLSYEAHLRASYISWIITKISNVYYFEQYIISCTLIKQSVNTNKGHDKLMNLSAVSEVHTLERKRKKA